MRQPAGYAAFVPRPLPPEKLRIDARLHALLSDADIAVGRLDGAVAVLPNSDLFLAQYVRREAVLSSQIEGTHASLIDVLEFEARMDAATAAVDVAEVVNYVAAMNHGLDRLRTLPLSRRVLCEVHGVLMRGVRGGEGSKTPGRFRRSQNWIGGSSPATARFVPPPPDVLGETFADLERFLHDSAPMPALIKAGIAHAQFETIHPFLDGNGRIGRLLITFWLVERGILRRPLLYPSLHFKAHRDEYVARLQAIRDQGDWEGWLAFFLEGIASVATEATDTAVRILERRELDRERIVSNAGRRAPNALALLDELFKRPIVTIGSVEQAIRVTGPTAAAVVRELSELDILHEVTGRRRGRVYAYKEYLDLFPDAASRE